MAWMKNNTMVFKDKLKQLNMLSNFSCKEVYVVEMNIRKMMWDAHEN